MTAPYVVELREWWVVESDEHGFWPRGDPDKGLLWKDVRLIAAALLTLTMEDYIGDLILAATRPGAAILVIDRSISQYHDFAIRLGARFDLQQAPPPAEWEQTDADLKSCITWPEHLRGRACIETERQRRGILRHRSAYRLTDAAAHMMRS